MNNEKKEECEKLVKNGEYTSVEDCLDALYGVKGGKRRASYKRRVSHKRRASHKRRTHRKHTHKRRH